MVKKTVISQVLSNVVEYEAFLLYKTSKVKVMKVNGTAHYNDKCAAQKMHDHCCFTVCLSIGTSVP